jgi:hypothetical protein
MSKRKSAHQDITALFLAEPRYKERGAGQGMVLPAPFLDPLGLLERASHGRTKDPIQDPLDNLNATVRAVLQALAMPKPGQSLWPGAGMHPPPPPALPPFRLPFPPRS